MKKLILLLIIPIMMLVTSCNSDDDPITPTPTGGIYLTTIPAGAAIWIDGSNTFNITPDTTVNVNEGVRSITLKLQDFSDTTFAISVTGGQTSVVTNIVLVTDISTTLYNPLRIYETYGTSASQPSGIDLSSGMAYAVSSPEANLVDIYFYSDAAGFSYLIQSADLYTGLIRRTDFFVSSNTNLFDEVDSPVRTNSWINKINDTENNYVFLYDHDGHYSKMKIVNRGGGSGPGDPSWVDIQWYYNDITLDKRF
ncbi:MAG TPA: PEGA domain-containing protein [Ignavibacteriaceae bacterium]